MIEIIKNVFNFQDIIEVFKGEEIIDFDERGRLMDFLPQITQDDMKILESWKKHFDDRDVAYAVTPRTGRPDELVLWKERVAGGKAGPP